MTNLDLIETLFPAKTVKRKSIALSRRKQEITCPSETLLSVIASPIVLGIRERRLKWTDNKQQTYLWKMGYSNRGLFCDCEFIAILVTRLNI
ncbi:hypothetical protein CEXT_638801 [Caerostris extrusa]|uniref:Uncharacterized protein n=1 Tax=Caerostris extrusa TaxID=172846 RepID=A0AAV4VNR6_CAEEX|nr:hypothetical protein CEXT_638801 [Caerostris extrusa]